jgi:hypothetical protein
VLRALPQRDAALAAQLQMIWAAAGPIQAELIASAAGAAVAAACDVAAQIHAVPVTVRQPVIRAGPERAVARDADLVDGADVAAGAAVVSVVEPIQAEAVALEGAARALAARLRAREAGVASVETHCSAPPTVQTTPS